MRFDQLKSREFITLLASTATAWPLAARAQQSEAVRRIGIVMPFAKGDSEGEARIRAFKQELAKLGWTDGGNIQFDERWPADNMDLVRSHAASLVASNPDIIVVAGGRIVLVLMRLTRFELSMLGKSLELLKQIAPATVRVALIYNPDNPNSVHYRSISEGASARLAIETVDHPIHGLADIDRAVASLADRGNSGIFFLPDITTNALRDDVVALVARRHIPAIYSDSFFVKIGGLAFYGPDRTDLFRRSAGYVDRILRGEKPGDLPFQQPTKYELMINLKAAKALGLELSPALLALADEVIE